MEASGESRNRPKETLMCFRISSVVENALLMTILALSMAANAQITESTLHTFTETTNFWPQGTLIEDSAGNLYGITKAGGAYGVGSVYELSPPAGGGLTWTLTTLYSFVPYGGGGYVPISELIQDSSGAFYGTTYYGGDPICSCGVVYKLTPPSVKGGVWTEKALYAFTTQNADGRLPAQAAPTMNSQGTIYGVTIAGGAWNSGTIFQLTPGTGGTYTESVLYSFGNAGDGSVPNGPLTMDASGTLYGVTSLGGAFNNGTVYKFVPGSSGQAGTESLLFSFKSGTKSGATPSGSLLFDGSGNLYGVTNSGGSGQNDGVAYELTPAKGSWAQKVLYTFSRTSGANPIAGLTWAPGGALYGTTSTQNGKTTGDGTVFLLSPPTVTGGSWTLTTLFQFTYATVGGYPNGRVTIDPVSGTLYGTASNGGVTGCDLFCGTIWRIVNP
jgi:uncharacterized repeat protein (TIGR03803 family)